MFSHLLSTWINLVFKQNLREMNSTPIMTRTTIFRKLIEKRSKQAVRHLIKFDSNSPAKLCSCSECSISIFFHSPLFRYFFLPPTHTARERERDFNAWQTLRSKARIHERFVCSNIRDPLSVFVSATFTQSFSLLARALSCNLHTVDCAPHLSNRFACHTFF